MTDREVLQAYRTAVIDLQELTIQLEHTGHSGCPRQALGLRLDALRGTNDPVAAALQAANGIEEMIERKRSELAELAGPVGMLMGQISNPRTFMVIQSYYLRAETDANIARDMCMSRCRVNQIRNDYLAQLC